MSSPNKYYLVEEVIESRNMNDSVVALTLLLKNGGIDAILTWCIRTCLAFDHDLDKSMMTIFGGEFGEQYFYLKFKVMETNDPKAAATN